MSLPVSSNMVLKRPDVKRSPASNSGTQKDPTEIFHEISARERILNDQPELLQQFEMNLLPVLRKMYGSSVNGPVRNKCISVIVKLMYFSTAETIQSLLRVANISSLLAGVLAWKDPHILVQALQIAETMLRFLQDANTVMLLSSSKLSALKELIFVLVVYHDDSKGKATTREKIQMNSYSPV